MFAYRLTSKGHFAEIVRVPKDELAHAEIGERFLTADGITVALGEGEFTTLAPTAETIYLIAFAKMLRAHETALDLVLPWFEDAEAEVARLTAKATPAERAKWLGKIGPAREAVDRANKVR